VQGDGDGPTQIRLNTLRLIVYSINAKTSANPINSPQSSASKSGSSDRVDRPSILHHNMASHNTQSDQNRGDRKYGSILVEGLWKWQWKRTRGWGDAADDSGANINQRIINANNFQHA